MPPLEARERTKSDPSRRWLRLSPSKSLPPVLHHAEMNSCECITEREREREKDQHSLFKPEANYHIPKTQIKRYHQHAQRRKTEGLCIIGVYFTLTIYRGYEGFFCLKKTGLFAIFVTRGWGSQAKFLELRVQCMQNDQTTAYR